MFRPREKIGRERRDALMTAARPIRRNETRPPAKPSLVGPSALSQINWISFFASYCIFPSFVYNHENLIRNK